jgi:bifunctional DNA-binding transcriptional regulator/antitoxin component of YhaV-PrlF toxin-antitoxin module
MNTERWTITTEEDPETGDIIIPLPPDLLAKVGWQEGDTLEWIDNDDGTWSIEKVKDDKEDLL